MDPVIAAFQQSLFSADPTETLLMAESGAHGIDPSAAPRKAAAAVAAWLGWPFAAYDGLTQALMVEFVLTQLANLRPLTNGPSVAQLAGNFYSWHY